MGGGLKVGVGRGGGVWLAMLGVGMMLGIGDVNQEYKVLYNVTKGTVQY